MEERIVPQLLELDRQGQLEKAYQFIMRRIVKLRLTLLINGTFQNKRGSLVLNVHTLTTILQAELRASKIANVSNCTQRYICEHVVKRVLEYHLGDIQSENDFPDLR